MNWVHCSKCFSKFQPPTKFHLVECGHILCDKCIIKTRQTRQCSVCSKTTGIMELSKDMDSMTQMYFWPYETLLGQVLKVLNFQSIHKNSFLQASTKKYNFAKRECVNNHNINKKLQQENHLLRGMLKSAGCNVPPPFITSTPAKTSGQSYDHNMSTLSSIRATPRSIPGSAQRLYDKVVRHRRVQGPTSANSSAKDPSPAQKVPIGYPAPVHRDLSTQNPAAATPGYLYKVRATSGYPLLGFPKK